MKNKTINICSNIIGTSTLVKCKPLLTKFTESVYYNPKTKEVFYNLEDKPFGKGEIINGILEITRFKNGLL